jgi:hypothetical protein
MPTVEVGRRRCCAGHLWYFHYPGKPWCPTLGKRKKDASLTRSGDLDRFAIYEEEIVVGIV